jgi:hypothetical protein
MDKSVNVSVNGEAVPLNPFVQTIFTNVISALLESLDGLPASIEAVDIKIEKP